jgi:shikimate kinase
MMKSKRDNIYLIGPMGAGKTTIGKKLAKKLGKRFFDSDREIEKTTGATINLIFDVEGEAGFREWESKTLEILSEANRELLKKNGIVIYLEAAPELIVKRTEYDNNRPLLATKNKLKTITELLNVREPIYDKTADYKINVDKKSTSRIINEISELLEEK